MTDTSEELTDKDSVILVTVVVKILVPSIVVKVENE